MLKMNVSGENICVSINDGSISEAKDELLTKLYYARNKQTMGGHKGWEYLISLYFSGDYSGMIDYIRSCKGYGGKTRNECIRLLNTIEGGVC